MYMRFMSDLHLEFGPMVVPELDTDKDTVLVLAGDIAVADVPSTYKTFFEDVCGRFRHVIYVCGNHEHYKGSPQRSFEKIKRALKGLVPVTYKYDHDTATASEEFTNLTLAENTVVEIDDVSFICATMWTDFANSNPMAMINARHVMSDYKVIRTEDSPGGDPYGRRLRPEDTVRWHRKTIEFFIDAIEKAKTAGRKVVVVTHHAPSFQSVPDRFRGDTLNSAYVSSLDRFMETFNPNYWIHGHIHDTQDYNIGETNVLANPRGYYGHELNLDFDPNWLIEL